MQSAITYLSAFGATKLPSSKPHVTILLVNASKVEIGPNWIEISHERDEEDDLRKSWIRHTSTNFNNEPMEDFWPYFFHINMVVDLKQFLSAAFDGAGISDKRAIWHIRQALRKTA